MLKNISTVVLPAMMAVSAIAAVPMTASALTFDFQFDDTQDGTVTPPIVGTGTFSFDGDPGDGTFALTSLSNFDFSFDFSGETFTNADLDTPIANVQVQIATVGSDRFVTFGGTGGGFNNGSLDFVNADTTQIFLTFFSDFDSGYLTNVLGGDYEGVAVEETSVPEPSAILGLLLVGSMGALTRKRK